MKLESLSRQATPAVLVAAALGTLWLANAARTALKGRALEAAAEAAALETAVEDASEALSDEASLRDMKARDLERFKEGLPKLAASRRALYEGGLQLQEELRLLQKQWEIVSTYLLIDEAQKKIHLMRGEQSLESYPVAEAPARAFGGENKPPQAPSPIVSKERYANPERGGYEEKGGRLQWEPPQVGTSARSGALGEYVMFTRGSLILHGPPRNGKEHDAFPHYCLGLSARIARKLYGHSFIGTKIAVSRSPSAPRKGPKP